MNDDDNNSPPTRADEVEEINDTETNIDSSVNESSDGDAAPENNSALDARDCDVSVLRRRRLDFLKKETLSVDTSQGEQDLESASQEQETAEGTEASKNTEGTEQPTGISKSWTLFFTQNSR